MNRHRTWSRNLFPRSRKRTYTYFAAENLAELTKTVNSATSFTSGESGVFGMTCLLKHTATERKCRSPLGGNLYTVYHKVTDDNNKWGSSLRRPTLTTVVIMDGTPPSTDAPPVGSRPLPPHAVMGVLKEEHSWMGPMIVWMFVAIVVLSCAGTVIVKLMTSPWDLPVYVLPAIYLSSIAVHNVRYYHRDEANQILPDVHELEAGASNAADEGIKALYPAHFPILDDKKVN